MLRSGVSQNACYHGLPSVSKDRLLQPRCMDTGSKNACRLLLTELDGGLVGHLAILRVALTARALLEVALASPRRDVAALSCTTLCDAAREVQIEWPPRVAIARSRAVSKCFRSCLNASHDLARSEPKTYVVLLVSQPQRMPHLPPRGPGRKH